MSKKEDKMLLALVGAGAFALWYFSKDKKDSKGGENRPETNPLSETASQGSGTLGSVSVPEGSMDVAQDMIGPGRKVLYFNQGPISSAVLDRDRPDAPFARSPNEYGPLGNL